MIFITARFRIKPEHAEQWPEIASSFTQATQAEDGCLWFFWSRSVDEPDVYVLVEAFRDGESGGRHVQSDHFKAAQAELPQYLVETPQIISTEVAQDGWSALGEMAVD